MGAKLPNEYELADRFGVSRGMIREAAEAAGLRGHQRPCYDGRQHTGVRRAEAGGLTRWMRIGLCTKPVERSYIEKFSSTAKPNNDNSIV